MSGVNPDGSHYHDPGIKWISYFNGGEAIHGFNRATYGFPQSVGCVETPIDMAAQIWPYTPDRDARDDRAVEAPRRRKRCGKARPRQCRALR